MACAQHCPLRAITSSFFCVGCNASSLASPQAVNLSSHVVVFVSKKYLVSANCNQEVILTGVLFAFVRLLLCLLLSKCRAVLFSTQNLMP
jgi:hypothetical protein